MTSTGSRAATVPALLPRAGAVAVAAVLVLMALAPSAGAHEAAAGIRYRITDVAPEVEGLTIQVVRGLAGQLVLANDTDEQVEVLDGAGRAFLRIGPDGVAADVASGAWRASDRPFGLAGVERGSERGVAGGNLDGPSRWTSLSTSSSWGWYDHRLHASEITPPPQATEPVVIETWEIPLRVGDRDVVVSGQTVAGPPLGFVTPQLVSDREPAAGVRVTLLPGQATGLLLAVDPGTEAVVQGEAGEPFLRFADGVVQANAASPTWHRTGGAQAEPVAIDASADPSWQRVAGGQQYGWIEPRALAPEVDGNPADGAVLSTWAVPLVVDGEPTLVRGELHWARTAAASQGTGFPWWNIGLALAGIGAVVALLVVRRRAGRRRT